MEQKMMGIIRRIDDLGRIVIPKEIRGHLGMGTGDAMEIFATCDGKVMMKPYRNRKANIRELIAQMSFALGNSDFDEPESWEIMSHIEAIEEYLKGN